MSDPAMLGASLVLLGLFAALARSAAERERAVAEMGVATRVMVGSPDTGRPGPDRERLVTAGLMIIGAAFGAAVVGPLGSVLGAGSCWGARAMARRRGTKRRADLLEAQLADAVTAIAAALRAGLSLSQAVAYAADETEAPLGDILRRAAERESLGEPLDAALERWASEVGSDDALLVNGVLALHRRTGGDLPRVLDRVAETLGERRETAREVRALTAQARLSGAILGFLPIGFFLFLVVTSRRDIAAAFHTSAGVAAIGLGFAMQGSAFVWIRRLLRVV